MEIHEYIILAIIIFVNLCVAMMLIGSVAGSFFGAPFIPSGNKITEKMVKMAKVKKTDRVFDLGCGDGRIVFMAEKYSDYCVGVEISPPVWLIAQLRKLITRKKAKIRLGDIFSIKDIKEADVIFIYLLPQMVKRFHKKIYPQLKSGTRIVCHAFTIKELKPSKIITREESGHAPLFLFIKP